jgi:triosephosphate isomerase (TIM)
VLIAGNWKMHKTPSETEAFCVAFEPPDGVDVVICPPFTSLREAFACNLPVYAQNVHWDDEGAYTGEVSAAMLRELGVDGALVGHSERRLYFGERDEAVAKRARHALDAGLGVIACVGETEEEREAGVTEAVLRRQVGVLEPHDNLVIAYEPVWAIGTGKVASPEQVQEAHALIKALLDVPVLYGGSCKPENVEPIFGCSDVDGALVGGASLQVESFTAICEAAARIRS